jgi:fumarate reductase subunit D
MNDAYGIDRAGRPDRLERELRAWLREFDPGEIPPAQRVAVFAGLGARSSDRSWARVRLAVRITSIATSLVLGGVIVAAWRALDMSAGVVMPGAQLTPSIPTMPQIDGSPATRYDAVVLVAVALVSCLAAASTRLPLVRRVFVRLIMGRSPEAVTEPRQLRRWTAAPRPAWAIVLVSLAYNVWWMSRLQLGGVQTLQQARLYFLTLCLAAGLFLPSVAIVLRYRFAERSTQLMLAAVFAPMLNAVIVLALPWGALDASQSYVVGLVAAFVLNLGPVLLAVGIARRAGFVRRPPWWLLAGVVGVVVALEWSIVAYRSDDLVLGGAWSGDVLRRLPEALVVFSWAIVAWIGLDASRRTREPWPWRLVAVGGLASAIARLPEIVFPLGLMFWPNLVDQGSPSVLRGLNLTPVWDLAILLSLGVAMGLLAGLRRPPGATRAETVVAAPDAGSDRPS